MTNTDSTLVIKFEVLCTFSERGRNPILRASNLNIFLFFPYTPVILETDTKLEKTNWKGPKLVPVLYAVLVFNSLETRVDWYKFNLIVVQVNSAMLSVQMTALHETWSATIND